jgi:hypothetical protein
MQLSAEEEEVDIHTYGGHTWNELWQMSRVGTWSVGEQMSVDTEDCEPIRRWK